MSKVSYTPTFKYNTWSQAFKHPIKFSKEAFQNSLHPKATVKGLIDGRREKVEPGSTEAGKARQDSFRQRWNNQPDLQGYDPMDPQDTVVLSSLA